MLVFWTGYCVGVWAYDHITSGCTPFGTVAWPGKAAASGEIGIKCAGASQGSGTATTLPFTPTAPTHTGGQTQTQSSSATAAQKYRHNLTGNY